MSGYCFIPIHYLRGGIRTRFLCMPSSLTGFAVQT